MEFEVVVWDGEELHVGPWPQDFYAFPLVPPEDQLAEVLSGKAGGELPRYSRVRMHFKLEYVNPTPLTTASGGLWIVSASGEEVLLKNVVVGDTNPVDEADFDVTAHLNVPNPAMGVNPVKLSMGPASTVGGIPLPETVYRVWLRIYGSWGW